MEQEKQLTSLPENAYRELAPGEEYTPMLPASAAPAEVTPYSVGMGIVMAIVFSAAAAYLGLKIGQVFEAAIPIAIIAVGMGSVLGKRNMLGQNVIIQSIGASSGVIVAGAIFTLPALYILGLDAAFYQIFLSSLFGGLLGIVLLIPFRSYFVKEMHGKYPFPEATATTEVLVSGEKGGAQAKLLAVAGAVGGLYDFVVSTFGAWTESVSTRICDFGAMCADKFKVVFGLNTGAAVLGLGYIIGLKYATIITAGSCLVWFLVVPLVGSVIPDAASVSPEQLFKDFGRPIGIGGIAMAGLVGIVRQAGIIRQALGLAVKELGGKKTAEQTTVRTQRDLTMRLILTVVIATLAALLVFFQFGVLGNWAQTLVALAIVFVIAFLFYDRGGQRHRHRGDESRVGHDAHDADPFVAGARLDRTERQERHDGRAGHRRRGLHGPLDGRRLHHRFEDRLLDRHDAGQAGGVEIPRHGRFGGDGGGCDDRAQPHLRFRGRGCARGAAGQCDGGRDPALDGGRHDAVGALFHRRRAGAGAHLDRRAGAGLLAGDVHPHGAERPLVVGGLVAWYVSTRSKDDAVNKARLDRGTLIASGFIAGGALMGVVSAVLKFAGADWYFGQWASSNGAEWLGLAMYAALIGYMAWHTMRAKPEQE